jgi:hypothetical protein
MPPAPRDPVRRRLFKLAGAVGCVGCLGAAPAPGATPPLPELFDDLENRTFNFFWHQVNPANGLVPDRYPSKSNCSIAAVGFALTAYPIGVERGYVSRADAAQRVVTTLRFFANAPQGARRSGVSGYQGFFYHQLDMGSGLRAERCELSSIDTALLLAGMLYCQGYFDRADAIEAEIRQLAERVYSNVDWTWLRIRAPLICMGWTPEHGFIRTDWRGYVEAMIMVLLALGSPTHAVGPDAWAGWTATYDLTWGSYYGYEHLGFAPLFGHQYSHVWVDFRGLQDAYMRSRGLDYFENSRRAAYAQRAYAIANPMGWKGYDASVWGLTACDGPVHGRFDYGGELRQFKDYAARGAGIRHTLDDGTIAPTASIACLPFAPEIVVESVVELKRRYGAHIYSEYGFLDAFNKSFAFGGPLKYGHVVPGFGWVDTDYLGIDQGPILAMIGNYRDDLVWRVMRRNRYLRAGLIKAGFSGGWLANS